MTATTNIPNPLAPIAGPTGLISPSWYRFLAQFHTSFLGFNTGNATIPSTITLTETAAGSVVVPSSGSQTLFIDSADHRLKRKDSTGSVTVIA